MADLETAAFAGPPRVTAIAEATLRRHRQEPRDFAVEADGQWPAVHEAFEGVSHDGGDGAGHPVYFVPEAWTDGLDDIESALSALSAGERNDFAIGGDEAREPLLARDPRLALAHALLDAFFEDWPDVMPPPGAIIRGGWAEASRAVRELLHDGPACRACGCTEHAACSDPVSGDTCAWASPNLCTACVGIVQRVFTPAELTFLLHAAGGGDLNLTRPDASALTAEGVLALRETLRAITPRTEGES